MSWDHDTAIVVTVGLLFTAPGGVEIAPLNASFVDPPCLPAV